MPDPIAARVEPQAQSRPPQTIYVVYGETGEYSDHTEWNVAAYTREEDAKEHARMATEWYQESRAFELRYSERATTNPHDPHMRIDYTGTSWAYYPVELRTSLPPTARAADGATP